MNKGMIFNMQKFSTNDGPGVRTTVFFKGCPLHCKWCSNPESQAENIQILYDKEKCAECHTCIHTCPQHAVSYINSKITINPQKCTGCLNCVRSCPTDALSYEGECRTVQEIVDYCLQDIDFYEQSGGGVTLSGGEILMQPEFAAALIHELKLHNIHVTLETTGYAPSEIFKAVTEQADLLLYDIKHWNESEHIVGTGVSNKIILENMKQAIAHGKALLPRLPVIPGFNNSLKDAKGFARLLKEIGAKEVQLLPFHQFGQKKYEKLERDYAYSDTKALYPEDLEDFKDVFAKNNIHAFF